MKRQKNNSNITNNDNNTMSSSHTVHSTNSNSNSNNSNDDQIFGVPLRNNFQNRGQALPPIITQMMAFVLDHLSAAHVGIFRKCISVKRVDLLRNLIEQTRDEPFNPIVIESQLNHASSISTVITDTNNGIEAMVYDIANMIKNYFRELPERLLTNKLSQTLIDIFTCKLNCFSYT
jgi:deleted in liver cancer protein